MRPVPRRSPHRLGTSAAPGPVRLERLRSAHGPLEAKPAVARGPARSPNGPVPLRRSAAADRRPGRRPRRFRNPAPQPAPRPRAATCPLRPDAARLKARRFRHRSSVWPLLRSEAPVGPRLRCSWPRPERSPPVPPRSGRGPGPLRPPPRWRPKPPGRSWRRAPSPDGRGRGQEPKAGRSDVGCVHSVRRSVALKRRS